MWPWAYYRFEFFRFNPFLPELYQSGTFNAGFNLILNKVGINLVPKQSGFRYYLGMFVSFAGLLVRVVGAL